MNQKEPIICPWVTAGDNVYVNYHNDEWGREVYDSKLLFEKLCLDGQQAGLSWITILKKKQGYHDAFCQFEPADIAQLTTAQLTLLMDNSNIVRNKLKINSIHKNALGYLKMEEQGINFSEFLWSFVGGSPIQNNYGCSDEVPTHNEMSLAMSKELKKWGFNFVGPTICYAFMEAIGMFNNHLTSCDYHKECL
jgi:DNA-3-methyladenine glycosylase I